MFTEALKRHEEYRQQCFVDKGGYPAYDAEIGRKISQLNWLISKAQMLNNKVETSISSGKDIDIEALEELEIITESFYYFVGRIVEIFKRNPRFGNISMSNAEKIRHQLLQHPEKQKERQKAFPSFECGSVDGPKIKSYKGPDGALYDNGLFVNARELNRKIIHVFNNRA